MNADPKPYPHRCDDLDGNAHCRCGVMSIHDPVVGETWGRNCPAALRERIAELEATLANERGEGEPPSEGWARNDIDPKREGVAWYVRWEADGSEPQEDDTEQTRVAWVRRTEGCMIEWMWEIEKSVGRMSDPMLASGRAPTARAAMIAADAARGGR